MAAVFVNKPVCLFNRFLPAYSTIYQHLFCTNKHKYETEGSPDAKLYPHHIPTSALQKALLTAGSAVGAILNPYRHDLVALLGETTGRFAVESINDKMMNDLEGRSILRDQPRINSETLDLDSLQNLPEDSFGHAYFRFLHDNGVSPDTRAPVHFVDDPDLAYVMQRYREVHDLIHTLLGMPTNMLGEVAVKWVEAIQTGLPMCYAGALAGPIRLRSKQRDRYLKFYLPWALECGYSSKFLMNIYFEQRWKQSLQDLRAELNIIKPPDEI